MKKIKEDLLKLKVEIEAKNPIIYREIALLVDKPNFLSEVSEVRNLLKIDKPIGMSHKDWWLASYSWAKTNPGKDKQLMIHAKRLCKKFKKPLHLVNSIYQAILFGKVVGESISVSIVDNHTKFDRPYVVIYPSMHTTNSEAVEALTRAKKLLQLEKSPAFSGLPVPKFGARKLNLHHEIKTHREWYWRNLSGESYTDITLSLESKKVREDYLRRKRDGIANTGRDLLTLYGQVTQAVRRYKRALEK